jgi:lipoprotein NlpI
VIRLFAGEVKPEAVAAAADADPTTKEAHACEASFYSGQFALIQGNRDEAVKLFQAAAKECPRGFIEGIAATAELKGMGEKL